MSSTNNELFYKEGYDLTFQNAKSLLDISILAAEKSQFGVACSLNILSAEEGLKAIFIITKHYFPTKPLNSFEKVFKDHKVKHKELKDILKLHEEIKRQTTDNLQVLEPALNILQQKMTEFTGSDRELYDSILEDVVFYRKQLAISLNTTDIFKWLSTANDDKNKGFYVDMQSDRWSSPQAFSSEKYLKERNYTEDILNYVTNIEELYGKHADLQNRS